MICHTGHACTVAGAHAGMYAVPALQASFSIAGRESCLEMHFQQAFFLSCCNQEELVTVLELGNRLVAKVLDATILVEGIQN